MFHHSPQPPPLDYLLLGEARHLTDQGDEDQQTKADMDVRSVCLSRGEARPPKDGRVEKEG